MHLKASSSSLLAFSSFFLVGSSLPFFHLGDTNLKPRATYSVVAVNGPSTPSLSASTVSETISKTVSKTISQTLTQTNTPSPITKTLVTTDIEATTDHTISTKTVEGPETTETVLVTIKPSPATVTATGYSVVGVSSRPATELPSLASTVTASPLSTVSATSVPATSTPAVSATTVSAPATSLQYSPTFSTTRTLAPSYSTPTSSAIIVSQASTSAIGSPASSSASYSVPAVTSMAHTPSAYSATPSSTTTYDNGQWHTYYPDPWANSTWSRAAKRAEVAQHLA